MNGQLTITVIVNGVPYERAVEPRLLLSDFLRQDLGLTGTHVGCEHGVCGACTILLDGQAARSCITFAVQADGLEVMTVEGLTPGPSAPLGADGPSTGPGAGPATPLRAGPLTGLRASGGDELHPLQAAFREAHALQCGFCTPGFLMTLVAMLQDNPHPSEQEIREALSGNLCRCTGYQNIVEAAKRVCETAIRR